jgi:hypothetical protein
LHPIRFDVDKLARAGDTRTTSLDKGRNKNAAGKVKCAVGGI